MWIHTYIHIYIERGIVGREEGDKETRNIGAGLFGMVRTHIKDCEVLLGFQGGK